MYTHIQITNTHVLKHASPPWGFRMFWLNKHKLVYALRWRSAALRDSKKPFSLQKWFWWKTNMSANPQKTSSKVNLFFFLKCPCQHCPNHLPPFAGLQFRGRELETDMAISGALQMVSALGCRNITQTLKEPPWSRAQWGQTSRENNQHLGWELSTEQKVKREWFGTSARDISQKNSTNKWERSDARDLWLQRNLVEQ